MDAPAKAGILSKEESKLNRRMLQKREAKLTPHMMQKEELLSAKVVIRGGGIEIEADAGYPLEHLENLLGRLATIC